MDHDSGLQTQIDQLRRKWPQAHCEPPSVKDDGRRLIIIPGMVLPAGWSHTICTALFKVWTWGERLGEPLNGFFVDLADLRLASGAMPHYTSTDAPVLWEVEPFLSKPLGPEAYEGWDEAAKKVFADPNRFWISGHPQWRGLTRFWWKAQAFDPNHDTLFTAAMLIRQRLQRVC